MNKMFVTLAVLLIATTASAQEIPIESGRFQKGDMLAWKAPDFDDSAWPLLALDKTWDQQGVENPNGFGWYRLHVVIPSSLRQGVVPELLLDLGPIDDADEAWINGHFVGKTGSSPADKEGYAGEWTTPRRYVAAAEWINWDGDNVIAVRVYNGGNPGGFYQGKVRIVKPELKDLVKISMLKEEGGFRVILSSVVKTSGTLQFNTADVLSGDVESSTHKKISIAARKEKSFSCPLAPHKRLAVLYRDSRYETPLGVEICAPYILTPPAPATPRYNGAQVFGVRPGSPVIFRLAFSGEKPMKYAVEGLPDGVILDPDKGVLSGSCAVEGDYPLTLTASNAKGSTSARFTLKVGPQIGLTPPMGWNSWNCWGLSVSQEKVMASAVALVNRGLADYGYSYINIDDAWEADERNPDGSISPNDKFPDMKALGDWLHSNGLKLGIYSSPGDRTCGGYLGSLDHEEQDARTWAGWGVDYLKYDWCGYSKVFDSSKDQSAAAYLRPYMKMQQYLREQPRDIFYSLCQYGMAQVWEWGAFVDANSWRTTGDIQDSWQSLSDIGFGRQVELYPYAGPGHWNDPDMLVVGKVGWSDKLRDSRLTPDEQYTHISLWSLLAANMLIGCSLDQLDDFTFNLLCNNEVNAVNQDVLGRQAQRDVDEDGIQIWSRELSDGGVAVGIFNLNETAVPVRLSDALAKIGRETDTVRDLWRQKDIPAAETYVIPSHGVRFVKLFSAHEQKH